MLANVLTYNPAHRILWSNMVTYSLLSRLGNVLVGFEEGADVHGLAAPDVSVDGPVEGELEGAAVELAIAFIRAVRESRDVGGHGTGSEGWPWWVVCRALRPVNGIVASLLAYVSCLGVWL